MSSEVATHQATSGRPRPAALPSQFKLETLNFGLDGEQTGRMETTEETEDCSASEKLHKPNGGL